MTLRCALYRALFRFKQTRLAGRLFFHGGQPFRVLQRGVTARGLVLDVSAHQIDGDWTFGIRPDPQTARALSVSHLHCEITPCDREVLATFMARLRVGGLVELTGDLCFDPPHGGEAGGGFEIHPVRSGVILPAFEEA